MKRLVELMLCISMVLLVSCATTPNVQYQDPTAIETVTADFGSTDLQTLAESMTDSLLDYPPIAELTTLTRPVIYVDTVRNKTMEHIDTESITDSISTKLLRSGKFRFVDMTKAETVKDQLEYQNESGMVNPASAMTFGRQIGAQYMLYGNLSSIEKQTDRMRDVYYKLTLRLLNLETGLVDWADEKELRKTAQKRVFGP